MSTYNIYFHGELQHMFSWRNKKDISTFGFTFLKATLSMFYTFIDQISRMTLIDSFEFHFFITCL